MLPPLEPQDARSAAAMLAAAAAAGTHVVPHGHKTKLQTRLDADRTAPLSSLRLTSGLVHYAGDLVATVPAGCTLREANVALAAERQCLPLDPPFADTATLGGIVGANSSGPRRHRYGSARDLIIGIEVALPSGTVARSGGRVVKNVAGYDLARLFCGSHGSLGVITSVTFKLAPIPPSSSTVVARFASAARAASAAVELSATASLTPSTIELVAPDPRLLVRFETTAASAEQMASATAAVLAAGGASVDVVSGADEGIWASHQALESAPAAMIAALSVLPSVLGTALDDVSRAADARSVTWSATGRAALGLLRIHADGEDAALRAFAADLRKAIERRGGHLQFSARTTLRDNLDLNGPLGSAAAVNFAVKHRFDPSGVLPYPWTRG